MAYKPTAHGGSLNAYLDDLAHTRYPRAGYSLEHRIAHLDILSPPPPIVDYDGRSSSGTCSPTQTDYAPPSSASSHGFPFPYPSVHPSSGNKATRFAPAQGNRPLRLATSPRAGQQARFQALFEMALSPRVPVRESARFLDRFRYLLCTSQLLTDSHLPSAPPPGLPTPSQREKRKATSFAFDAEEQATWDERRVAKYWMGSGGCVLLTSLLLAWSLKRSQAPSAGTARKDAHQQRHTQTVVQDRARAQATLCMTLLLARFLWAQSRRAYRRLLHVRATDRCSQLLSQAERFDGICLQALALLGQREQNVAHASASGQHIHSQPDETVQLSLAGSIQLLSLALNRAFDGLLAIASPAESGNLAALYNIDLSRPSAPEARFAAPEADASTSEFRTALEQIHTRRRQVLCCLLAVQADGRPDQMSIWKIVVQNLSTLSQLTTQLATQLEDALEGEAKQSRALIAVNKQQGPQEKDVQALARLVRRAQAKMHVTLQSFHRVDEGMHDTDHDFEDDAQESASSARVQMVQQYDHLGTELEALLEAWQAGRAALDRHALQQQQHAYRRQLAHGQRRTLFTESAADTSLTRTQTTSQSGMRGFKRPDSLGFWGPRISMLGQQDTNRLPFGDEAGLSSVLEGYVAGSMEEDVETAQERARQIAAMRAEREAKQARTAARLQQQQQQQQQGWPRLQSPEPASSLSGTTTTARARQVVFAEQAPPTRSMSMGHGHVHNNGPRRPRGLRLSIGLAPQGTQGVAEHDIKRLPLSQAAAAQRKQEQEMLGGPLSAMARARPPKTAVRESLVRNVSSGSDGSALSMATWTTGGDSGLGASTASYGSRF